MGEGKTYGGISGTDFPLGAVGNTHLEWDD